MTKKSAVAKVAGAFLGFAMLLSLVVPSAAVAQTSQDAQIQELLNLISSLQAQLAALQGGSSTSTGTPINVNFGSCNFTKNFKMGASDPEVLDVQRFLNSDPSTMVASTGVGSAGQETSYFGTLTHNAVIKFQNKYAADVLTPIGLSAGTGNWFSMTRAKANMLCSSASSNTGSNTGTGTTIPAANGLTIQLAPGSPDFTVIPLNASASKFGSFLFSAGSQSVEITELVVGRTGLGDRDDFNDVWINVNGAQFADDRSIVAGDFATFPLISTPLVIPAGQTYTVDIMGSLKGNADDAGHYNALGFKSITTRNNAPINATLPIFAGMTTIGTQAATVVTVTAQGSDKTVSVGNTATEIGRFQIDINSSNDQDVVIESITLENEGTMDDLHNRLANIQLRTDGQNVAKSVTINGDLVTFVLDGYEMEDGKTQTFQILADIVNAEVNDTLQFQLDEDHDMVAREVATGSGTRINGNDGTATTPAKNVDLKTYTVETGDVGLSINNANSRNVAPGIDDVVLLDGDLTIDAGIRVEGLKVRLQSGTDTDGDIVSDINSNFENVTLRINGIAIDTVDTLTNASGGAASEAFVTGSSGDYYDFSSSFTLDAGTHNITVEADVQSDATPDDKLKLVVFSADFDSPEYTASGDTVPSGELTGQTDGSTITIQTATLTANRNDGNSSETIVSGTDGIKVMGFTLTANDSTDINVTSMTFTLAPASTYPASFVTNMRIEVDGVAQGSQVDLSSGIISDLDFIVPESEQVQVELFADTNTGTTSTTMQIDLDDIDAFDVEGNSATVNVAGAAIGTGNPVSSDNFTVSTGGTFTMTIDGNTPDEDILIGDGGSVWYPVASYRLTAEDEDLKVTDLHFANATSSTDNQATSSHSDDRVMTMGVFDENGVLKGEKDFVTGELHFDLGEDLNSDGLGAILVPADDFTKITIRAKLNNIADGDKTGRLLRLILNQYKGSGESDGGLGMGVTVQSTATGDDLATTSLTAARTPTTAAYRGTSTVADMFAMRRTKPTITVVPQTSSETTLTNGSQKVLFRFTVSADSNEDIAWKGIKFDVTGRFGGVAMGSTTGAATFNEQTSGSSSSGFASSTGDGGNAFLTAFELYETSSNQEVQDGNYVYQIDWDGTNDNGELAIIVNDGREEVVGAGQSKTYELRATVSGATTDGDFTDIVIDSEADDAATAAYLVDFSDPDEVDGTADSDVDMTAQSPATSPYSFLWSDNSGSPHSLDDNNATADQRDWTNDRFVDISNSSWNKTADFN